MTTAPLRGRRARGQRNPSLFWGRVRRGVRRQAGVLVVVALLVAALGAGAEYLFGNASLLRIAAVWLAIGALAGFVVAVTRDLSRNTIVSLSNLGKHRGYSILGAAPDLTAQSLRELAPDKRTPVGCLAFQPASAFATAFRDLQGALEHERMVAFIGATANEGATTAALCTAISAQQQGRTVLLVDCDIRRRSLSQLLDSDPDFGVLEAAEDPDRWRDALCQENETGLHILPAAPSNNPWRNLFSASGFSALLEHLKENYDLVVLDCPPALSIADGAMIARLADKCVLVAAWDETPLSAVRGAMRALQRRPGDAIGLYINRVPPKYRFGRLRGA
jgi:Mrp family chromosome partitioning ATPase